MKLLPPVKFTAKLTKKEQLNKNTVSLWFKPDNESFKYFAGQFVTVIFSLATAPDEILTRSYSIASAPSETGEFELCIGIIPNGKGSNYLASLEINENVSFKGPYGFCYIKPENQNSLAMVATGTGIAPIKAILEDLANKKDERAIDVLFGVRTQSDLFYLKELKDLAARLPDSKIIITLSKPDQLWMGYEGRVTSHLAQLKFNSANTDFYICGNGDMIKEVRQFVLNAGVKSQNIHIEIFD